MIKIAQSQSGFWDFLADVLRNHGVTALLLIAVCILFYRLIWKVWSQAMEAKNQEIERLVKERDKYQELFFRRLRSSDPGLFDDHQSTENGA